MITEKPVKLRFAPSPTGPITFGNARTALFNWLYAKHNKGTFLLRIEDTDKKRSEKKYEENIIKTLNWLGIDWDGEIYRQSERLDLYEKYMNNLLEEEKAYWCFCSKEELEEEKEAQISQGLAPKYSGKCRSITQDEAKERIADGESAVLRFKMPKTTITFQDIVRNKVKFDTDRMGDFVIATDTDRPLYNLAVVIDDHEMEITHVVRGEDHISNTPKQIALYNALGFGEPPRYAHVPLILAEGGGKLSKRMQQNSILDFKEKGYLPEAIFNFMALLGWHPKEDREVIKREEAIEEFTLRRVQKSGAAMNLEKLSWYNGYYIRNKPAEELYEYIKDFVPEKWYNEKEKIIKALEIEKQRMKVLTDFKEKASFFFELPDYEEKMVIWKDKREDSTSNLEAILEFIKENNFHIKSIEEFIEDLSEKVGGKGEVYWPLRVAMSGQKASPGPLEIMSVLGHKESTRRLEIALDKLKELV